jgi:hypothetical protein
MRQNKRAKQKMMAYLWWSCDGKSAVKELRLLLWSSPQELSSYVIQLARARKSFVVYASGSIKCGCRQYDSDGCHHLGVSERCFVLSAPKKGFLK